MVDVGERIDAGRGGHHAVLEAEPEATVEVDGTNTAVALAAMKLGNDEAFDRVEQAMRKLIPSLQRIRIQRALVSTGHQAVSGNKIVFDFRGAPGVANQISYSRVELGKSNAHAAAGSSRTGRRAITQARRCPSYAASRQALSRLNGR